jgi:hypothetical protein
MPQQEEGQRFHARIVRALEDRETELAREPDRIQFLYSVNNDQFEEIVSYNDLMNSLESEEDGKGDVWKFHRISAHQGPLLTQRL